MNSSPLLHRRPFHQGNTGYRYNPYTFILTTPSGDPETTRHRMGEDVVNVGMQLHSGMTHEQTHWIQQHSTTIGFLLSLLRHCCANLALETIASLPQAEKDELLLARNTPENPLVGIDPDSGQAISFAAKASTKFNSAANVCVSFVRTIGLFEHSLTHQAKWGISNTLIPSLANYAYSQVGRTANMPPKFPIENAGPIIFENEEITTHGLFECHASVNELLAIFSYIGMIAHDGNREELFGKWFDRFNEVSNGEYGVPLRWFLTAVGASPESLVEWVITCGIVCFAALNPPLGFAHIAEKQIGTNLSWDKVYPPKRFINLSKAVARVGTSPSSDLGAPPDSAALHRYLQDLSVASAVPISFPIDNPDTAVATNQQGSRSPLPILSAYRLWYLSQIKDKLPLVSEFGRASSGPYCEAYFPQFLSDSADISVAAHGQFGNFDPPIQWCETGELEVVGEHVEVKRKFLEVTAQEYCMHDLLFSSGPLKLRDYPAIGQTAANLRMRTVNALRERIGSDKIS